MLFGLKNASGTFVRLMRSILHPIRDSSEAYIDDSYTISSDFDSHCLDVRKFLSVVRDAGLTLNLSKCQFAHMHKPVFHSLAILLVVVASFQTHPK